MIFRIFLMASLMVVSSSIEKRSLGDVQIALCVAAKKALNIFSWNSCSEGKFFDNYKKMRAANCRNCDKYFHCMANYEAVYRCSGSNRKKVASIMSACRDSESCTDPDCVADRRANEYGRNGGNCAGRYLCQSTNRCAYNPQDETCKSSNC